MPGSEHHRAAPAGSLPPDAGTVAADPPDGTEALDEGRPRNTARGLAVPVIIAAVLVPYALAFSGIWSRTGDDLAQARSERAGVTQLRPLVQLIAATADAQTAAVSGAQVDALALRAAMAAADAADARVGVTLGTDRRWTDVRSRLDHLLSSPPRGSAAYTAFSQVIDLETAMLRAVVDSSSLRVDPQLDVHYLVEAGGVHVPAVLVTAGRMSDLTLIVEQRGTVARADTITVVVAQSELRQVAGQLDDGLRKGFESSSSRTLGPNLLRELDRLRDAVTAMAPPMTAIGSVPDVPGFTTTQNARQQLRGAALEAETATLDQLDELLGTRISAMSDDRRTLAGITGAGLVVAVLMLWFASPRRRCEAVPGWPVEPAEPEGGTSAGRAGTPAPLDDGAVRGDHRGADLLEARELLQHQRLIHIGRTVTASASERKDAAKPPGEGK